MLRSVRDLDDAQMTHRNKPTFLVQKIRAGHRPATNSTMEHYIRREVRRGDKRNITSFVVSAVNNTRNGKHNNNNTSTAFKCTTE